MNSLILCLVILILGLSAALFLPVRSTRRFRKGMQTTNALLQTTLEERQKLAQELNELLSHGVTSEMLIEIRNQIEETKISKNGLTEQLSIAETEADSLNSRLTELDAVIAEFEKSGERNKDDYAKMIEMESQAVRETESLRNELQSTFVELDKMLEQLSDSRVVIEQVNLMKSHVDMLMESVSAQEAETKELKEKYYGLKKSYDALDLEYAQLYERQSIASGE